MLATSDEWGATKPDAVFFDKLVAVSGHDRHEIAYVGDRLDNDIAPAAQAGLFTVWVRRGHWGSVLRRGDPILAGKLPEGRAVDDGGHAQRPGNRAEHGSDSRHKIVHPDDRERLIDATSSGQRSGIVGRARRNWAVRWSDNGAQTNGSR